MKRLRALAFSSSALLIGAPSAHAGTLEVLHNFTGGSDGALPLAGVTLDTAGHLYGEALVGGLVCGAETIVPAGDGSYGCGVVYEISASAGFATLHTFQGSEGALGSGPIAISHGHLLGTTLAGGGKGVKDPSAYGTLFSLNLGNDKVDALASFNYNGRTGALPSGFPKVIGKTIYGVTDLRGPSGCGTLYSRDIGGEVTVLHGFTCPSPGFPSPKGSQPNRILVSKKGIIFGSTYLGGSGGGDQGSGVIYAYNLADKTFKVIYSFIGGADGANPQLGGLAADDSLYGETNSGGANGIGTIFKLEIGYSGYTLKLLHTFTGGADGGYPLAPPTLSAGGTLTGTTSDGGGKPSGSPFLQGGTIYQISGGRFSTLYAFDSSSGPYLPYATPTVSPTGVIYGTTYQGGKTNCKTSTGLVISTTGCGVVYSYTRSGAKERLGLHRNVSTGPSRSLQ